MNRAGRFALAGAAATLLGTFGSAAAAQAHISVTPDSAPQGGDARISFVVPNESDTASTTKLDFQFPVDHPIPSVKVLPLAGWTVKVITAKLPQPVTTDDGTVTEAVTEIVWIASSTTTGIQPGQFQDFTVALGGLPKVDSIPFKAVQSYSDGTTSSWIDLPVTGQPEPEHPAPILKLTPGSLEKGADQATADKAGSGKSGILASATPASAAKATDSGGSALFVAIIGALLGLAGLVLGGIAFARSRSAS